MGTHLVSPNKLFTTIQYMVYASYYWYRNTTELQMLYIPSIPLGSLTPTVLSAFWEVSAGVWSSIQSGHKSMSWIKYIPEARYSMEQPAFQKLEQTGRSGGLRKSSKFVFKLLIKTLGLGVPSADRYWPATTKSGFPRSSPVLRDGAQHAPIHRA